MKFLRPKAEQLADHLRDSIARGEVREPLPSIRAWSAKLGVGLHTLETALQILHRQRVVNVRPRRGIQLLNAGAGATGSTQQRLVRWICYGRDFPDLSVLTDVFGAILARLHAHDIGFSIEPCDAARLRVLHAKGESPTQMYMLTSLPDEFQRLFSDFKRSALINGLPAPGVSLPYITIDVFSAIRHAVHTLARRGFRHVILIMKEGSRQPVSELFRQCCAEAPEPMQGEVVTMPIELAEQVRAAGRFAARIRGRRGIIVVYAIPASVVMTALMAHGVKIPTEVEVIAMNTPMQAIRVFPLPTHYPFPLDAFGKAVCRAALHYFERGRLPSLRKRIPLEMADPAGL